MATTSLHHMLSEMATWGNTNEFLKDESLKKITTSNCPRLKSAVNGWMQGMYDEDPDLLINELISLASDPRLKKSKK
jgi:hypothetical protein